MMQVICLCPEIENLKISLFIQYDAPCHMKEISLLLVLIFGCIFPKNRLVGSYFPMFLFAGFCCISI